MDSLYTFALWLMIVHYKFRVRAVERNIERMDTLRVAHRYGRRAAAHEPQPPRAPCAAPQITDEGQRGSKFSKIGYGVMPDADKWTSRCAADAAAAAAARAPCAHATPPTRARLRGAGSGPLWSGSRTRSSAPRPTRSSCRSASASRASRRGARRAAPRRTCTPRVTRRPCGARAHAVFGRRPRAMRCVHADARTRCRSIRGGGRSRWVAKGRRCGRRVREGALSIVYVGSESVPVR